MNTSPILERMSYINATINFENYREKLKYVKNIKNLDDCEKAIILTKKSLNNAYDPLLKSKLGIKLANLSVVKRLFITNNCSEIPNSSN